MNKLEEKKQVVLNLSLPLIELADNQVHDCDRYPKSGKYFVKSLDGCFYLADVDKENQKNWYNGLPANIGNMLVEQQAIISMEAMLTERLHRLEDVVISSTKETVACVDINCKTIAAKVEKLWDKCEEKDVSMKDIPQTVVKLLNEQQPQQSSKGMGFVSQEALVEIIRTIK